MCCGSLKGASGIGSVAGSAVAGLTDAVGEMTGKAVPFKLSRTLLEQ